MSLVVLSALVASLAAAAPTPFLDAASDALLEGQVVRALQADGRVDVVEWEGDLITVECVRDVACLSRRADVNDARYVVFGTAGRAGHVTLLALDGYDTRTGTFAGRETKHASTEQDLSLGVETMVAAVLDRLLASSSTGGRVIFLGVLSALDTTPPDERETEIPFGLIGAASVQAGGVALLGVTGVLLALAWERDQAAAAARYQRTAARYEEQRNLWALLGLMTTTMAGGATLLAAMVASWAVFADDAP